MTKLPKFTFRLDEAYKRLGLKVRAPLTESDLRRAFCHCAKACHPDTHPHDPLAAEKFRELNEAYTCLRETLKLRPVCGDLKSQPPAAQTPSPVKATKSSSGRVLITTVELTYREMILGTRKAIPTEFGNVIIAIPSGVTDGTQIRLAKSAPKEQDHLLTCRLIYPEECSVEQREALTYLVMSAKLWAAGKSLQTKEAELRQFTKNLGLRI